MRGRAKSPADHRTISSVHRNLPYMCLTDGLAPAPRVGVAGLGALPSRSSLTGRVAASEFPAPRCRSRALRSVQRSAVGSFLLGLAVGLGSTLAHRRLLRRRRLDSLGHALVQAAVRGPQGLDVKARAAYQLIRAAAEAGVKEFSSSLELSIRAVLHGTDFIPPTLSVLLSGLAEFWSFSNLT